MHFLHSLCVFKFFLYRATRHLLMIVDKAKKLLKLKIRKIQYFSSYLHTAVKTLSVQEGRRNTRWTPLNSACSNSLGGSTSGGVWESTVSSWELSLQSYTRSNTVFIPITNAKPLSTGKPWSSPFYHTDTIDFLIKGIFVIGWEYWFGGWRNF